MAWGVLVDGAPAGANITEWAKREECWRKMRDELWSPSDAVREGFVALGPQGTTAASNPSEINDPKVAACAAVGGEAWWALANWARQTSNLEPWQRKLAYDIGTRMKRGRPPSVNQARYGVRILDEARRLGFIVEPD